MAVRWRRDGSIVCAAESEPREDDTYIDDPLHYKLATELGVLLTNDEGKTWQWANPTAQYWIERVRAMKAVCDAADALVDKARIVVKGGIDSNQVIFMARDWQTVIEALMGLALVNEQK